MEGDDTEKGKWEPITYKLLKELKQQASLFFCLPSSLGEDPLKGFTPKSTLWILSTLLPQRLLFQKILYPPQPQAMLWEALGAKWGTPRPWEAQTEVVAIALN